MSDTKPPQNKKKDEVDLKKPAPVSAIIGTSINDAIVTDITRSARALAETIHSPSLVLATQNLANLGTVMTVNNGMLIDLNNSAKVLTDLAHSPVFIQAGKVVSSIQQLTTNFATLTEPTIRLTEASDRVISSVVSLNKKYDFGLTVEQISLSPSFSPSPSYSPSPSPSPAFEVRSAVMALKERFDNLADDISLKVEERFKKQVDNYIKEGIISPRIKSANCVCSKCGNLIFKIEDMSHFMRGTHKCSKCSETLQIPKDLKIIPDK
ncbi:MAG: hypothetical protein WDN47_02640 [Candidatus Doudnabacteria bacterium]